MAIRKVAAAIILNPEGKILIMKRSSKKKIHPNLWGLPAGSLVGKESLEETAMREIWEETSLEIKTLKEGPALSVEVPSGLQEITYFLGETQTSRIHLNDEHSRHPGLHPKKPWIINSAYRETTLKKFWKNSACYKTKIN